MTLAVWPEQLPLPEQSGYAIQHVSPLQRTQMVSGRARQRRVYTSVPSMVAVTFVFTDQAQIQFFEVWYRYVIADGADWFLGGLLTPIGLSMYECRFSDIYQGPTLIAFNRWSVTATLEIRERQTIDSSYVYAVNQIPYSSEIDIAINSRIFA